MNTICTICGKPLHAPYRSYDSKGHISQGCVSAEHCGHLIEFSQSSAWHNRKEAKVIRQGLTKFNRNTGA